MRKQSRDWQGTRRDLYGLTNQPVKTGMGFVKFCNWDLAVFKFESAVIHPGSQLLDIVVVLVQNVNRCVRRSFLCGNSHIPGCWGNSAEYGFAPNSRLAVLYFSVQCVEHWVTGWRCVQAKYSVRESKHYCDQTCGRTRVSFFGASMTFLHIYFERNHAKYTNTILLTS